MSLFVVSILAEGELASTGFGERCLALHVFICLDEYMLTATS
jgi:hypothetical protein